MEKNLINLNTLKNLGADVETLMRYKISNELKNKINFEKEIITNDFDTLNFLLMLLKSNLNILLKKVIYYDSNSSKISQVFERNNNIIEEYYIEKYNYSQTITHTKTFIDSDKYFYLKKYSVNLETNEIEKIYESYETIYNDKNQIIEIKKDGKTIEKREYNNKNELIKQQLIHIGDKYNEISPFNKNSINIYENNKLVKVYLSNNASIETNDHELFEKFEYNKNGDLIYYEKINEYYLKINYNENDTVSIETNVVSNSKIEIDKFKVNIECKKSENSEKIKITHELFKKIFNTDNILYLIILAKTDILNNLYTNSEIIINNNTLYSYNLSQFFFNLIKETNNSYNIKKLHVLIHGNYITYYEFDKEGKILYKIADKPIYFEKYEYNEKGNLIKKTLYELNNVNFDKYDFDKIIKTYEYLYNENNKLIQKIYNNFPNNETIITEYKYNEIENSIEILKKENDYIFFREFKKFNENNEIIKYEKSYYLFNRHEYFELIYNNNKLIDVKLSKKVKKFNVK